MLKLLKIFPSSPDAGINSIDEYLLELMTKSGPRNLPKIADLLLQKGKELEEKKLIKFENLKISIHKKKSCDWNVLQIRYKKGFRNYEIELVLSEGPKPVEI